MIHATMINLEKYKAFRVFVMGTTFFLQSKQKLILHLLINEGSLLPTKNGILTIFGTRSRSFFYGTFI